LHQDLLDGIPVCLQTRECLRQINPQVDLLLLQLTAGLPHRLIQHTAYLNKLSQDWVWICLEGDDLDKIIQ
jgi:hypothetical protein